MLFQVVIMAAMNALHYEVDMNQNDRKKISQLPIRELLAHWPQMSEIFLRWRMSCVGCPITRFETACDAALNYSCELETFLTRLELCIGRKSKLAKHADRVMRERH